MAKYDVTYKCNHTGRVDIFGTNVNGERERAAARCAERLCPDCYKAQKDAEVKRTNDGLIALEGSEKQVAWAQRIRAEKLEAFKAAAEKAATEMAMAESATDEQIAAAIAKVGAEKYKEMQEGFYSVRNAIVDKYNKALTEKAATWWIDNRF